MEVLDGKGEGEGVWETGDNKLCERCMGLGQSGVHAKTRREVHVHLTGTGGQWTRCDPTVSKGAGVS